MVPRTAMPPGTARVPPRTGIQRVVNPMDRPTTQQGLGGIKTKSQGPGRQVQDITFFQTELRQKLNAIVEETKRLHVQLEQQQKENQNYATFEKKADGLAQELRDLQDQLGDLNTLVDKLHTDTDLQVFEKEYIELQGKNKEVSDSLDELFLKRQQREQLIRDIELQVSAEQSKQEEQINGLDSQRKEQYMQLKVTNSQYIQKVQLQEQKIEDLQRQWMKLEKELEKNSFHRRALDLFQRLIEARQRHSELQSFLSQNSESGPQERERLLQQVKNDNLETSGMERRIAEMEEQIRVLKDQIAMHNLEQDSNQGNRCSCS
jgi:intraflagellar transport protein 74